MAEEHREWIVMRCLDAYHDEHGNPGQHKEPVVGYNSPMTKEEALQALKYLERQHPGEDLSIRRLGDVVNLYRE